MARTFTFWLTLGAILLSLLNLLDFDSGNAMLYSWSIPVWIIEATTDNIHQVSKAVLYILTILQFFLIGYAMDYTRKQIRKKYGRTSR
jgi:hypothetical protein